MKEIRVEYFALLVQEAKTATEVVKTSATTLEQLFQELKKNHSFSLSKVQIRAAINTQLTTDWHAPLAHGDHILFIPPLVGG